MAFNPRYTITDRILNNLTRIASAREFIEQSRILPKWEMRMKRQAILHNTHSSTAIEGNRMTLEQVEAIADGKDIMATDKDKKEVLNYLKALERLPEFTKKGKIKIEDILAMHKILTKGTLRKDSDSGTYRDKQVFVGRRVFEGTSFKEEVQYMPPETKVVPVLMEEFVDWLNTGKVRDINAVLLAGIAHYEIARIHPFIDGNGRTARLLAAAIFYMSGFDHRRLFALDDYYDRDRNAYYAALKTVQDSGGDMTGWLEYFTSGVTFSVNEVKEVISKVGIKKVSGRRGQVTLTQKQMKVLEHINAHGKVTNRELQSMFNISAQAIHKELTKLVDLKLIKPEGKGRSIYYVLV